MRQGGEFYEKDGVVMFRQVRDGVTVTDRPAEQEDFEANPGALAVSHPSSTVGNDAGLDDMDRAALIARGQELGMAGTPPDSMTTDEIRAAVRSAIAAPPSSKSSVSNPPPPANA